MWRTLRILLTAALVGVAGGCSSGTASGPTPPTTICQPAGGNRCAGPAPVQTWLYGPLVVAADGLTLSGRFECGGSLEAVETNDQVTLTFIAAAVGAGGLSCALVPLRVGLHHPLGSRAVVDGVTHQRLAVRSS
ncbi:MAG: hypothetical protein KGQ66_16650 [Acidobacteriota bacterium]|nr:hypothetical protein [Acidobacteriota bacterium]